MCILEFLWIFQTQGDNHRWNSHERLSLPPCRAIFSKVSADIDRQQARIHTVERDRKAIVRSKIQVALRNLQSKRDRYCRCTKADTKDPDTARVIILFYWWAEAHSDSANYFFCNGSDPCAAHGCYLISDPPPSHQPALTKQRAASFFPWASDNFPIGDGGINRTPDHILGLTRATTTSLRKLQDLRRSCRHSLFTASATMGRHGITNRDRNVVHRFEV